MTRTFTMVMLPIALLVGMLMVVAQRQARAAEGYVIERDAEIARPGPGPHNGLGRSTGYVFFERVPNLKFSFRKRVLHKGASIGYHLQEADEVYYLLSGSGKMTINGDTFPVKPGDAMLTRKGSSHGLHNTGEGDLSLIVTYEVK